MASREHSPKECNDKRPCFARNEDGKCKILKSSYNDKLCPFCKPEKDVTNGVKYPYNPERCKP